MNAQKSASADDAEDSLRHYRGQRRPLIAIVGATGTGKSALAVALAHEVKARGHAAEVVSADAMQLYAGMNIGTAKVTEVQQEGVVHHMLDVLEPGQEATVAGYQKYARKTVEDIEARNAVPILVGGSGLYVNAVLYDFHFPGSDPKVRERLNTRLKGQGLNVLVRELCSADPKAAETVDLNNPRRVIRALEVLAVTGQPMASHLPEAPVPVRDTMLIHVTEERGVLVARLDKRVEDMWADGLIAETESLIAAGIRTGPTASRAIGYAQALAQIDGTCTEAQAIEETQKLTRRYARRQVSWFKRLPNQIHITSEESQDPQVLHRLIDRWESVGNDGEGIQHDSA